MVTLAQVWVLWCYINFYGIMWEIERKYFILNSNSYSSNKVKKLLFTSNVWNIFLIASCMQVVIAEVGEKE